jgi:hypothetical protein
MNDYDKKWLARVLANSETTDSGCILWIGHLHPTGYAGSVYRGKTSRVHRVMYEIHHGVSLTRWEFVCHTCDVRNCINIDHLWLGTPKQNSVDAMLKGRQRNQKITHCPQGHEYTEANTYLNAKSNKRNCRECQRTRQRAA